MDEPTNDLDVETLELLEELLGDYAGTLILVSHDREFLDNVVTSTLVMEGDGRVGEYVGGYSDWVRQRPAAAGASAPARSLAAAVAPVAAPVPAAPPEAARPKRRLSYREQQELDALPGRIDALETEIAALAATLQDAAAYRPGGAGAAAQARLAAAQAELDAAYGRWAELD